MKEKIDAEAIRIKSPCSESWDEMFGSEKTRACSHCEKNVNDISMLTEDEAWELIDESNGSLCVRFESHPVTNAPIFRDTLYQITRQTGVAAGVLGATLAVSSIANAQKTNGNNPPQTPITITKTNSTGNSQTKTTKPPKVDPTPKPIRKLMGKIAIRRFIKNPLMLAVQQSKNLKVRLMIAQGVNVNEKDLGYYSRSALHIAVESNNLKMIQMLLNAGADVDLQDSRKSTPLMVTNWQTSEEIIRLLVQYGADLNAKTLSGQTALMDAARSGKIKIVRALLESGADVLIRDNYNNSALDMTYNEEIKQLLIAYGAVKKVEIQ